MLCEKNAKKKQTNIPIPGKFCLVASQRATNADSDCRLAGTSVNEVNIVVKCFNRFPIPKLDF